MRRSSDPSLAVLVQNLYDLPGCGSGGPLHIVTDDGNCTNGDLSFCRGAAEAYPPAVCDVANEIIDLLEPMSEDEREEALGWR